VHRNADNRRSHHALSGPRLSTCECGAKHERHHACQSCGKYRGKQVLDIVARTEREQARAKRKEASLRDMGIDTAAPEKEKEDTKAAKESKKGKIEKTEK